MVILLYKIKLYYEIYKWYYVIIDLIITDIMLCLIVI